MVKTRFPATELTPYKIENRKLDDEKGKVRNTRAEFRMQVTVLRSFANVKTVKAWSLHTSFAAWRQLVTVDLLINRTGAIELVAKRIGTNIGPCLSPNVHHLRRKKWFVNKPRLPVK